MEKSNYVNLNPMGIESDSMEIISRELSHLQIPKQYDSIVKRVIHTTADFEYAQLFEAHPDAVELGKKALQQSCRIYADTSMIVAGVSKPSLRKLGCELQCFVHDEEVVTEAKAQGITRSICGINKAVEDDRFRIFVIGNAPTALVRLCELYAEGKIKPDLVIGVPVGFVGAAESKQMLKESGLPYLLIRGRKGGSTVGVAMLNAILYELIKRN
ncbi:precorrin-8X methylmutase [Sunxiuqinia indica]|uniref:precorrin-8X methylmutase n=1 Tax=Sunxiuqinia indica TaxID=2692584 RepID=UPI00135AF633|nr:precorrin-8X methylmutase [Sunxiuqinia indica]